MTPEEALLEVQRTRLELDTVRRGLDAAIDQIKMWQAHPEQAPTAAEMQRHKEGLLGTYARYRVLEGKYEANLNRTGRLLNQRQSAKNAFQQGWVARLTDIMAQLDGPDYTELRDALNRIANDDEIPY